MTKRFLLITVVLTLLLVGTTAFAQQDYTPLRALPGAEGAQSLQGYLKALFNVGIGIAGILSVLMLMYGGVQYMTTEAFTGKSEAKDIIWRALLGLLLAFTSWIILNTINTDLLNLDIDFKLESETSSTPAP